MTIEIWDTQDPRDHGWAWRTGGGSGRMDVEPGVRPAAGTRAAADGLRGHTVVVHDRHEKGVSMTTYTTIDSGGDSCGHRHRSIKQAVLCLRSHRQQCARRHEYSDRLVRRTDDRPFDALESQMVFDLRLWM